ncbi:MAG TPA: hypothetical protein PLW31_06375 [Bacteroidales bacterium]|nr:hypothetical protein [Bacteroidales bacterium]HOX77649.1 hypothetical protein [Bacteroidales bacterium]HPI87342.1 hypothetical protein [Bacteroidales bacterium]HPM93363.1 hypothetical protein [Bacteroidales bacterium]
MKKIIQVATVVLIFLVAASGASAQEWSKEQTEVWKVVQDTWKGWSSGDISGVTGNIHEKYQGWSDDSPLPIGKQTMIDWFNSMKDAVSFNYYDIQPARITVLNSAAVVDYYYYFNATWNMGEEKKTEEMKGKIAEFYVKDGGKWLLLGDLMVHEEVEKDD